jgi:hypothetical protein
MLYTSSPPPPRTLIVSSRISPLPLAPAGKPRQVSLIPTPEHTCSSLMVCDIALSWAYPLSAHPDIIMFLFISLLALDDLLVNRLTSSPAAPFLRQLIELFTNISADEPQVYTLRPPNPRSLLTLYAPPPRSSRDALEGWEDEVCWISRSVGITSFDFFSFLFFFFCCCAIIPFLKATTSSRLVIYTPSRFPCLTHIFLSSIPPYTSLHVEPTQLINLFATLGEKPYIRYYNPSTTPPLGPAALAQEHLCKRLAASVEKDLADYCHSNQEFPVCLLTLGLLSLENECS